MSEQFHVGNIVTKTKGYQFDGIVVASFTTSSGDKRYVVEEARSGMLHIFSGTQLALAGHNLTFIIQAILANRSEANSIAYGSLASAYGFGE